MRQTAWHHRDVMIARMARLMVTPSSSGLKTYQDRYGPAEGCLEALKDPLLADEAVANLPAALDVRAPRPDMVWALAARAREGNASAAKLLGTWDGQGHLKEPLTRLLEPEPSAHSDVDPERDVICEEVERGIFEDRTPEQAKPLVERFAERAGDRDFKALPGLLQDGFGEAGPGHRAAPEKW